MMRLESGSISTILTRSRAAFVLSSVLTLGACVGESDASNTRQSAGPEPGGTVTVLLEAGWNGSWPAGLDPATNTTGRANLSMMNAIFGGLFQLSAENDGSNPRVVGVLAAGYTIEDAGKAVVIQLRDGVTFSDGTPFDAEAVRFNIERSLATPCTCAPTTWPWDKETPVTTPDSLTVRLHFTRPYGAAVNAIPVTNINWIASPTALKAVGESNFKLTPVGAGPFRVVSNQLSSRLVLERNPLYWETGRPYLDGLIFQSINSEQAAYQALLAGDAQVFEGMTSTQLIQSAMNSSQVVLTLQPATSPYMVQLNTLRPPFDDSRAREAIYYATDVDAILAGLFNNLYPASQSFTGPGGLFHHPVVPGYRAYDLAKARAIVEELGGLRVTLATLRSFVAEQVITALQSQWEMAGIEVTIEVQELGAQIRALQTGSWDSMLMAIGSYDPEAGPGLSFRFHSQGTYTGVRDETLDRLIVDAAGTFDQQQRESLYLAAAKHISDNAYAPFLFAASRAQLSVPGLQGPGLSTKIPPVFVNTGVLWPEVWMSGVARSSRDDGQ
jgi:peptide/nickel transport system substrate-binding protein